MTSEIRLYQLRLDDPPDPGSRFLSSPGKPLVVDVHPWVRPHIDDPGIELWITEGSKKVDAAISHGLVCIGLAEVLTCRQGDAVTRIERLQPRFDEVG